jgi:hypothetical protein
LTKASRSLAKRARLIQLFDTIVAIVAKGCPEVGPALFNPLCKSHCIATQLSGCRYSSASTMALPRQT